MCHLWMLAVAASCCMDVEPPIPELVQAIANGYAANRESVDHGKATFIYLEGTASSPEAARRGELSDLSRAKGTYVFAGSRMKYERIFDREDVIAHTTVLNEHQSTTSLVGSVQVLTDGELTLFNMPYYDPLRKAFRRQAVIKSSNEPTHSFIFPLDLGAKDPPPGDIAHYIENAQKHVEGCKGLKYEEGIILEGRRVHKITFEYDSGDVTFWIDYQRGCVPVKSVARNSEGRVTHTTIWDQLTHIADKIWFPMRYVHFLHHVRPIARVMQVETMEIGPTPSDRDFSLSFPEPTTVLDVVHSRKYLDRISFSMANLGHPEERASKPILVVNSPAPPAPPQLPGERESGHSWVFYACLLVSLSLMIVVGFRISHGKRCAHEGRP